MRMALKLFRIERHLSQEKMAELLGFSRNHYAKVESGDQTNVSLKFLEALAGTFNISLEKAKELTAIEKKKKKNGCETRGE